MRLLLDTHAFLWFALNDRQLSATARALILDPNNRIELSPASYWEIAIKVSIRKYTLINKPFEQFIDDIVKANNFLILPILVRHVAVVASLPFHHNDPFDRLLVAQALVEQIPIVSVDPDLDAYGITRLW